MSGAAHSRDPREDFFRAGAGGARTPRDDLSRNGPKMQHNSAGPSRVARVNPATTRSSMGPGIADASPCRGGPDERGNPQGKVKHHDELNLVDKVKGYLSPDMVRNFGMQLGETSEATQRGLNSAIPAVMGSFARKASSDPSGVGIEHILSEAPRDSE